VASNDNGAPEHDVEPATTVVTCAEDEMAQNLENDEENAGAGASNTEYMDTDDDIEELKGPELLRSLENEYQREVSALTNYEKIMSKKTKAGWKEAEWALVGSHLGNSVHTQRFHHQKEREQEERNSESRKMYVVTQLKIVAFLDLLRAEQRQPCSVHILVQLKQTSHPQQYTCAQWPIQKFFMMDLAAWALASTQWAVLVPGHQTDCPWWGDARANLTMTSESSMVISLIFQKMPMISLMGLRKALLISGTKMVCSSTHLLKAMKVPPASRPTLSNLLL